MQNPNGNSFRVPYLLAVSLLAFAAGTLAEEPSSAGIAGALEKITNRPEYLHATWGFAISDLQSGKSLYEWNADKLFAPASTTKLFSSAAALVALGPDSHFVTSVFKSNDNLILRASGDPSFSGRLDTNGHLAWTNHDHTYASFDDKATLTDTDVLSTLKDMAQQISRAGIRQIHDVIIDDHLFEKAEGSGSGPSQLVPIVVNDNVVDILISPGSAAGQPASVTLRPVTPFIQVDSQVATVAGKEPVKMDLEQPAPNRFSLRGQIPLGHKPVLGIAEAANPAAFARALFIELLQAQNIVVEQSEFAAQDDKLVPPSSAYASLPVVATHTSPPFREQIKVILKVSHNLAASMLPLLMSGRTSEHTLESGMRQEGVLLKQIGVDVNAISFAGGAGGTRADFVTPHSVVQLLQAMAKRRDFAAYYDGLPVLGVDGTLFDAVGPDSPARGKVAAKTGTLVWENTLNNQLLVLSKAMAGYMTAVSGRKLAVAIYLNNLNVKDGKGIEDQGKVLGDVADLIYRTF